MPTPWPASLPDPTPADASWVLDLQLRRWQPEAGPPKVRRSPGPETARQAFRVVVDGSGYDTLLGYLRTVASGDLRMGLPAPDADTTETWTLDAESVRVRLLAGGQTHAARRYEVVFTALRTD